MNTGKEIIAFTKSMQNISKLDDIIDGYLEPVKDYSDTIGDLLAPVKAIKIIIDFKRKLTLRSFLRNFSQQVYNDYQIDEEETARLITFFDNQKNVMQVAETIDNALNAKSVKCSALLGVIAGRIIKDKTELNISTLSIIDSLRIMNDLDLENFIILIKYLKDNYNLMEQSERRTFNFYKSDTVHPNVNRELLELTIEKLKQTNGLSYDVGGLGSVGNARGAFVVTNITIDLYQLITKAKVLD